MNGQLNLFVTLVLLAITAGAALLFLSNIWNNPKPRNKKEVVTREVKGVPMFYDLADKLAIEADAIDEMFIEYRPGRRPMVFVVYKQSWCEKNNARDFVERYRLAEGR